MNQLTCALSVCCIDLSDLPSVINMRENMRLTMGCVVSGCSLQFQAFITLGRQLVALFGKGFPDWTMELWLCQNRCVTGYRPGELRASPCFQFALCFVLVVWGVSPQHVL